MGAGQAAEVAELVAGAGFDRVESRPDLAGIERVCSGVGADRASDGGRLDRARRRATPRARRSSSTIEDGGVAVFPADTLYGLACDPLNADAIERIHEIKGRDDGKPSAVLYFTPLAMRELIAGLGPRRRAAIGALLPGPGHAGHRQPRAPLPARLPRGPGAPRACA